MKTFEDNDVINGSWGEVWVDNDYMAQATALEATIKFTKTDVPQTGRLNSGKKVTGIEGSGTLKLNHASSYFKKRILTDIKNGKLTNCTFDEVKLVDWEANKLGEESIPFTFTTAEMLDTIDD